MKKAGRLGELFTRKRSHKETVAKTLADVPDVAEAALNVSDQEAVETGSLGPLAKLPPFRPVILTLLRLFDQSEVTIAEVTRLVESDPAVLSELLAVVNSPLFGMRGTVSSATHALTLLGMQRTRNLVSALAMRAMMANAPRTPVIRRFWTHSLATATTAHHLAPLFGDGVQIAYIAGIMHDLGRMGLLAAYTEQYTDVALMAHESVAAILAAEQTSCGMNHLHAGMKLAQAWGLPRLLHPSIGQHHDSPERDRGVLSLIQLSCCLADSLQFQAIHHHDAAKFEDVVETTAPKELREAIRGQMEQIQAAVLDTIQTLDY